ENIIGALGRYIEHGHHIRGSVRINIDSHIYLVLVEQVRVETTEGVLLIVPTFSVNDVHSSKRNVGFWPPASVRDRKENNSIPPGRPRDLVLKRKLASYFHAIYPDLPVTYDN